jgi:hypothetical protein
MDDIRHVRPTVDPGPARLSYAQKRDLAGIAASAVLSTVLIAAPVVGPLLTRDEAAPPAVLLTASAAPRPASVPSGPIVAAAAVVPQKAARPDRRVRAAIVPPLALPPASSVSAAAASPDADNPPASAQRKPLARRLTGILTGDGSYTVRPFPTVPARN